MEVPTDFPIRMANPIVAKAQFSLYIVEQQAGVLVLTLQRRQSRVTWTGYISIQMRVKKAAAVKADDFQYSCRITPHKIPLLYVNQQTDRVKTITASTVTWLSSLNPCLIFPSQIQHPLSGQKACSNWSQNT